jgi:hypothetical protein
MGECGGKLEGDDGAGPGHKEQRILGQCLGLADSLSPHSAQNLGVESPKFPLDLWVTGKVD